MVENTIVCKNVRKRVWGGGVHTHSLRVIIFAYFARLFQCQMLQGVYKNTPIKNPAELTPPRIWSHVWRFQEMAREGLRKRWRPLKWLNGREAAARVQPRNGCASDPVAPKRLAGDPSGPAMAARAIPAAPKRLHRRSQRPRYGCAGDLAPWWRSQRPDMAARAIVRPRNGARAIPLAPKRLRGQSCAPDTAARAIPRRCTRNPSSPATAVRRSTSDRSQRPQNGCAGDPASAKQPCDPSRLAIPAAPQWLHPRHGRADDPSGPETAAWPMGCGIQVWESSEREIGQRWPLHCKKGGGNNGNFGKNGVELGGLAASVGPETTAAEGSSF